MVTPEAVWVPLMERLVRALHCVLDDYEGERKERLALGRDLQDARRTAQEYQRSCKDLNVLLLEAEAKCAELERELAFYAAARYVDVQEDPWERSDTASPATPDSGTGW